MSLGFAELNEFPYLSYNNVKYLYCVPKYPTPLYDEDLKKMPNKFDKYYGYSDHALGITAALQSYLRGAKILEKHYTMGNFRQGATEKANLCAFTPESLKQFRNLMKEFEILNG